MGTGVPADGLRDLPDVSIFAGDGTVQNFYVYCEADLLGLDLDTPPVPCSLASPYEDFLTNGGTSFGAQAFAGIVAVMDQKQGGRQGNLNPLLYSLARGSSGSSIFHDVLTGTNAMPCLVEVGVTGCNIVGSGFTVGVLSGYNAGTGYDQATGLGSVNVTSLLGSVLSVTTASLPAGVKGIAYTSTTLGATGGASPYTWTPTPTAGSLPPGLVLSTAGAITGTPTATGSFSFTVKVSDSLGYTATGSFSITINERHLRCGDDGVATERGRERSLFFNDVAGVRWRRAVYLDNHDRNFAERIELIDRRRDQRYAYGGWNFNFHGQSADSTTTNSNTASLSITIAASPVPFSPSRRRSAFPPRAGRGHSLSP